MKRGPTTGGCKLADVALRLRGYRAHRDNAHYRTIASLPMTLGPDWAESAGFIDHIRVLRHRSDYESVGVASSDEVTEIRLEVERLRPAVERLVKD